SDGRRAGASAGRRGDRGRGPLGAGSVMLWWILGCDLEAPVNPAATEDILFEVPAGSTARGLASTLESAGLVQDAWRWEWFLRMGADGSCIKAGRHKV